MAMKKKYRFYGVLAILMILGGYMYLHVGGVVTRAAERIASDALGVAVDISSIHMSLADKSVMVRALKIGNPPGYRMPNAITADSIIIILGATNKQLIEFKDINVKGVDVYFEVNEHGVNIDDLKKLAQAKKQKKSVGSEQVRVIVNRMLIDASVIHPTISFYGRDLGTIRMPAVHVSGIGQDGGGSNAGTAIVYILGQYLTAIGRAVSNAGVLDNVPGMSDVEKSATSAVKKIKSLF